MASSTRPPKISTNPEEEPLDKDTLGSSESCRSSVTSFEIDSSRPSQEISVGICLDVADRGKAKEPTGKPPTLKKGGEGSGSTAQGQDVGYITIAYQTESVQERMDGDSIKVGRRDRGVYGVEQVPGPEGVGDKTAGQEAKQLPKRGKGRGLLGKMSNAFKAVSGRKEKS